MSKYRKVFLLSYLVLEIIFWFKQDAVFWNRFRFVFFQIVKKIWFFEKAPRYGQRYKEDGYYLSKVAVKSWKS